MVVSRAGAPPAGTSTWSGCSRAPSPLSAAGPRPAPTTSAFWLYSSGSTGRPKGTVHTHANLYWTAELYGKAVLGLTEHDVCFSAAKLFFAYGLGNALTFPLSVGASTLLMAERPTPDAVFKRWVEHRPTVFFGAPTGYAGMLASPDAAGARAVALRLLLIRGRGAAARHRRALHGQFGCDDHRRHRLDRDAAHLHFQPARATSATARSGKPVAGYDVELRDDDGQRDRRRRGRRPLHPGADRQR